MKIRNKIDPSHIWDIRDDNLDSTSKALLVRLAGLQHLEKIWVSNKTLAEDLGVSKRTIIEKVKSLATAGYIAERREVNEATQTKFTELNKDFIVEKVLGSAKGARKVALTKHYGTDRKPNKKRSLPVATAPEFYFDESMETSLDNLEADILGH